MSALRDKSLCESMPRSSLHHRTWNGKVEGRSYRLSRMRHLYDNLPPGSCHLDIPGTGLRYLLQVRLAPWHGGPIRPFGPPEGFFKWIEMAVNATKCRMLYNSLEFASKRGIEAFNLLNFLPSYLLNFSFSTLPPFILQSTLQEHLIIYYFFVYN